jgi:hypothetical protein
LGLKTGNSGLVIWYLKSPQWFLGLCLKIKRASVYQLHHKTVRERMTWDMHQDLAAFFGWKQVGVGFPNLVSRLVEVRRQVVHMTSSRRLHRVDAEDGWADPMDYGGPFYFKIIIFYVSGHRGM